MKCEEGVVLQVVSAYYGRRAGDRYCACVKDPVCLQSSGSAKLAEGTAMSCDGDTTLQSLTARVSTACNGASGCEISVCAASLDSRSYSAVPCGDAPEKYMKVDCCYVAP